METHSGLCWKSVVSSLVSPTSVGFAKTSANAGDEAESNNEEDHEKNGSKMGENSNRKKAVGKTFEEVGVAVGMVGELVVAAAGDRR